MKRRTFLQLAGAGVLASQFPKPALAQAATVRWWYHFDNPHNMRRELVAKFEKENPGIKVQAEAIPWGGGNDYTTRLFAALVAGQCAGLRAGQAQQSCTSAGDGGVRPARRHAERLGGPRRHRRSGVDGQPRRRRQTDIICRCTTSCSISITAPICSPPPACSRRRRMSNT